MNKKKIMSKLPLTEAEMSEVLDDLVIIEGPTNWGLLFIDGKPYGTQLRIVRNAAGITVELVWVDNIFRRMVRREEIKTYWEVAE